MQYDKSLVNTMMPDNINVYNEFEQVIACARGWIDNGYFIYNGLTYRRGINDNSACRLLSELATLRITDLAFHFDNLMCTHMGQSGIPAKGFTIGHGKKLYWYISPMPKSGTYRCIRQDENGDLCCPRSIHPLTIVTIHY